MFDTSIGETTLVVNSSAAARDLFDKRSAVYSSRPPNPFIFDMLSNGCAATHLPMGDRFRHYRKVMAQALKPSILQDQRQDVYREIVSFLAKLDNGPASTWCRENQVLAASLGSLIVSMWQSHLTLQLRPYTRLPLDLWTSYSKPRRCNTQRDADSE